MKNREDPKALPAVATAERERRNKPLSGSRCGILIRRLLPVSPAFTAYFFGVFARPERPARL